MTDNSLLKGTTWYWREGFRNRPIGSTPEKALELCLKIKNVMDGKSVLDELSESGILADIKTTHSFSDYIPDDSLIVYAHIGQGKENQREEKNIQKLERYIVERGGKIGNRRPQPPRSLFEVFKSLLNQRRK